MPATIESPIINSPFEPPQRQFAFDDGEITDRIIPGRRKSVYFIPIAKPKTKGKAQGSLDLSDATQVAEENRLINQLRERVGQWRDGGHRGTTQITRRLLEHWQRPDRERRLFFCQIEALETIIYLTEIAPTKDANQGTKILADLAALNRQATPDGHPPLNRLAAKMATGSGKTVVMAMLIAWQTLNKHASRQDKHFTNAFLVVAPGITIRDRLRTLLPSDPDNYYQTLDLVPRPYLDDLGSAEIVITNYHSFLARDRGDAAKLTKTLLQGKRPKSPFVETPGQVAERVCKGLSGSKEIVILNDEAHHCYHRKPRDEEDTALSGDAKAEAEQREADARVWINGLEAIARKRGVKAVFDLSATPFFLAGSGYREGMLFPWVVSDFALIDAIESSIVKVPRVPVEDNTANPEEPVYRHLWAKVSKALPSGTRKKKSDLPPGMLPKQLQSALHSLYSHYRHAYDHYQEQIAGGFAPMPPVLIVVCSNTKVSKLVFEWIAGYAKTLDDDGASALVPGHLEIFSNVEQHGADTRWRTRPNTLLIDSQQLESGEALSEDFKKAAAAEIEEFKAEIRQRFPGRALDTLTPEDLLREVMNTVGKPGKLGENIKCVVSVSMLTEGWDVNTVTHILGVRAFGTQLLCEQVVGRGLRRMSYEVEPHEITLADGQRVAFDAFPAEYAEVYGVPFGFLPMAGAGGEPKPPPNSTQVVSIPERQDATAIRFPRVTGYRYEIPVERLRWQFGPSTQLTLHTKDVPTIVESAPVIGETSIHCLEDLEGRRESEVAFRLAKQVLERYFAIEPVADEQTIGGGVEHDVQRWLFPQLLAITRRWLADCVLYKDSTFPQLLLLAQFADAAADRIYQAIVRGDQANSQTPRLRPILHPYNPVGDTDRVNYRTTRSTYRPSGKCPLSHVVADSGWEITLAQALERMHEVKAYVKNVAALDFIIPYTFESHERLYWPDFLVRIDDGHGEADLLNLLIEVSGEDKDDKPAKTHLIENLWVPAVNNSKQFGRWGFLEVTDPHLTMRAIRAFLSEQPSA